MNSREILEYYSNSAIAHIKEMGEAKPMFISQTNDGHDIVTVTPFRNDNEKIAMQQFMRIQHLAKNVVSYVFVNEVWYTDKINQLQSGKRVSDCDDRQEGLMILFVNDEMRMMRLYKIIRNSSNKIIDIVSSGLPDDTKIEGTFCELLPPKNLRTLKNQKAAQEMLKQTGSKITNIDPDEEETYTTGSRMIH